MRVTTFLALLFSCMLPMLVAGGPAAAETAQESFPAILLPGRTALIKSQQDERVAEVLVDVGSRVTQGQLLLRFVDAEERVEVKRAEVVLARTRAEFDRMSRLHGEEQISDELLEQSETAFQLAEADLELARIRLEELSIRSPFDGVVAERFVDPGTSVELGDPLLRTGSLSPLRLEAMLPEAVLPRFGGDTVLEVELQTPPTRFTVPVRVRPAVVDPASRTFLLRVEIDNPDERFVPGVGCTVSIRDR